jgi:hypothetical protein
VAADATSIALLVPCQDLRMRRFSLVGAPLGSSDDRRFQPVTRAGLSQGSGSVDDRPLVYQRLQRHPGNANDWYVVAAARNPVDPLYGVSGWSVALREASPARPLLLFDLNGFKAYNDAFGHPAGDALLIRLATALEAAMAEHGGCAYRLGGDEFCILAAVDPDATTPIIATASGRSPITAAGSRLPPPTGPSSCPRKARTLPRPCS